jgi:catechol 2,3-dioxygenase-like lactoylglutathione lyase family enzyme
MSGLERGHVIGFASTTDLARAREFYGDRLGLKCTHEDGFAAVFDANGTMVRITLVGELQPAPFTVLGWAVDDITAAARDLAGRGVEFLRIEGMGQDDDAVWTAPGGDRVAWFHDPDGNTLSLTQFVASA